jgi:hypothetical protein
VLDAIYALPQQLPRLQCGAGRGDAAGLPLRKRWTYQRNRTIDLREDVMKISFSRKILSNEDTPCPLVHSAFLLGFSLPLSP